MAEKPQSFEFSLGDAFRAEPDSIASAEPTRLSEVPGKSPQWNQNSLQRIESLRSGDPANETHTDLYPQLQPGEELEQLQQRILQLEAENARLALEQLVERDAQLAELRGLQEAYDQFEQQSDQLLDELEQQNERLRHECRQQNKRSLL